MLQMFRSTNIQGYLQAVLLPRAGRCHTLAAKEMPRVQQAVLPPCNEMPEVETMQDREAAVALFQRSTLQPVRMLRETSIKLTCHTGSESGQSATSQPQRMTLLKGRDEMNA